MAVPESLWGRSRSLLERTECCSSRQLSLVFTKLRFSSLIPDEVGDGVVPFLNPFLESPFILRCKDAQGRETMGRAGRNGAWTGLRRNRCSAM